MARSLEPRPRREAVSAESATTSGLLMQTRPRGGLLSLNSRACVHDQPLDMCGPDTDRPRGGALAALGPPRGGSHGVHILCGDLAFYTPGRPGSAAATHARLTPGAARGDAADLRDLRDLRVVIHSSGDLTRRASECGLFRQFTLPGAAAAVVERPLEQPLALEVGGGGIIGRRVSLCSRRASGQEFVVAEGIVGFNFVEQSRAP
ncbi:hypothetical protein TOPH_07919 [Tolypocladium ophioglossoides CBS 100239]|uniref:Uncharacterized protein n=1 Tax=Tolypocladium ophioglossoides (strain CBS 100239) TaxID=1163406 RepID=A0A0L0N0B9_TOLOC|nr:hypothetical protein TOPH_07919 [Tolypocladium ophioglossoides CBS 100239]